MLMDYMLNPIICVVWCSVAAQEVFSRVPYAAWVLAFVIVFTGLNLRGVQVSALVNAFLALGMSVAVVIFLATHFVILLSRSNRLAEPGLRRFIIQIHFQRAGFFTELQLPYLSIIGFDGISMMSEEVENPRRNVILGTVFTCLAIGLLSVAEVYAAQLVWPAKVPFAPSIVDTAFLVCRVSGGWKISFPVAECNSRSG